MSGNDFFCLVMVVVALAFGWAGGSHGRELTMRKEAITAGAAEYVITNKETGAVEFRWKESK